MSDSRKVNVQFGTSLSTLLTVLFVGLKLTGTIDWPWLWVLSPTLISVGLTLAVMVGGIGLLVILKKFEPRR